MGISGLDSTSDSMHLLGEFSSVLSSFGMCWTGVAEVFGPGQFTSCSSAFELPLGTAIDTRTGYDFTQAADRGRARETRQREKPALFAG